MNGHGLMSDTDRGLEGKAFLLHSAADRWRVVEWAFDYRGDVTLVLQSGERIEGYVFDRNTEVSSPYLRLFLKDNPGEKTVLLDDLREIIFSGEDTAFGKSWEEWIKKSQKVSRPAPR